jgi:hypothetical protein
VNREDAEGIEWVLVDRKAKPLWGVAGNPTHHNLGTEPAYLPAGPENRTNRTLVRFCPYK